MKEAVYRRRKRILPTKYQYTYQKNPEDLSIWGIICDVTNLDKNQMMLPNAIQTNRSFQEIPRPNRRLTKPIIAESNTNKAPTGARIASQPEPERRDQDSMLRPAAPHVTGSHTHFMRPQNTPGKIKSGDTSVVTWKAVNIAQIFCQPSIPDPRRDKP